MSASRRDVLKAVTSLSALHLAGMGTSWSVAEGLRKEAMAASEWIAFNRTLIAEAYNPPFYPSLDYTAPKAVEIALELGCDSFRFPAASYLAYFPTKSGYPVHPDLKGDPMAETLTLLKKAGLRAVAYVPLNHPFMAIDSKDPRYADWVRRFADGSAMTTSHYGFRRYFEGCLNSPVTDVVRKLVAEVLTYSFDVMYFDGPYEGMEHGRDFCYCKYCEAAYRKRFGVGIPGQKTGSLEERARYVAWMRDEVTMGFFKEIRQLVRSTRDVPVLFNDTGLLSKFEWRSRCVPVADGFMFEAADSPEEKLFNLQLGRSTGKVTWTYIGHHTEYNREHLKNQAVRGWFSYPVEEQELLLDGAVATAAGVGSVYWGMQRFFYEKQSPLAFDSGKYVREMFDFRRRHDTLFRSLKPRPQAGILVSDQTIDWYKGAMFVPSAYGNYYHGAFNLLKSLSVDSEPFLDWMMSDELLARYPLLFVPNAVCLSEAQCALLREYVANGGVLVATHLTSAADELGRPRPDFGLHDLFGASMQSKEPLEYPDLYLHTTSGGTVPQDPQIVRIQASSDATILATTYDRGNRRDLGPAIVSRRSGKGSVLYLASGLEAVYEETHLPVLRSYLGSLLMPHLAARQTYVVEFRPGLTPHLMASEHNIVLHLLADIGDKNIHQKARGSFTPLEDITVRIRVPRKVRAVSLMRTRLKPRYTQAGDWLTVHVSRVVAYEAIWVELI